MAYSEEYIQALLARVDVVDVVRSFLPLKETGSAGNREYVSRCPFHDEKTPSFKVTPRKQFYHCFGCGAHGNVIRFLIRHAEFSFPDAVVYLAKRYKFFPKQWKALKKRAVRGDK